MAEGSIIGARPYGNGFISYKTVTASQNLPWLDHVLYVQGTPAVIIDFKLPQLGTVPFGNGIWYFLFDDVGELSLTPYSGDLINGGAAWAVSSIGNPVLVMLISTPGAWYAQILARTTALHPGDVLSVVAGTGIVVDATDPQNPIVTNSAPDQTVVLTAGSGITIGGGGYPNFTITNSMAGVVMPIGEISYENATGTTVSIAASGTDYEVAPVTTLVTTNDAAASPHFDSPANGQLRWLSAGTTKVHLAISMSLESSLANKEWSVSIFKNAVKIPRSSFWIENPTGSGATAGLFMVAYHITTDLAQNDYIHAYIQNVTDTTDVIVRNLNIVAVASVMS